MAKATSVEYYTSGGGVAAGMESYYLDAVTEGEPPGVWLGSGAAELGLTGEVDPADMETLYGRFENPFTGEPIGNRPANRRSVAERIESALAAEPGASPERIAEIGRRIRSTDRANVIGWDATFAVPKSVTVVHTAAHRGELAAQRSGDAERVEAFRHVRVEIEDAIAEANAAGIAAVERVATARSAGGSGGAMTWVAAPGLTVASFFQHTNRSIDPHLHVHNVILNRAICEDGKARALDGQDLLAQRYAFSAVADRVLTESLTARLGLEMRDRPDGAGREVAVVPDEVIEHFSTRKQQMTAALKPKVQAFTERVGREPTDVELARLKTAAQRSSRAAKSHDGESSEELDRRWYAELVTDTGHDLENLANRVLAEAEAHLSARREFDDTRIEGDAGAAEWSPQAVIAQAIASCSTRSATWGRANLISELELHLPVVGISADRVPALLDSLADQALVSDDVVQISGMDAGSYAAPSATVYAARGTLAAEGALRRAAVQRGYASVPAEYVGVWLDENCPTIGADQRAAVEGLASCDAAVSVLVGPAGTGKSYAAGALDGAWRDLTGGRVVGLATSTAAANVLRDDGVAHTARNISTWLGIQDRLDNGSTSPEHRAWQLGPDDVVMVDEASMVATGDLERILAHAQAAGARIVLTGDPRQLAAVEAGGVMELLDGHAQTFTLGEVRRFRAEWEREASLALRDAEPNALADYDRHGRLIGHDTVDEATAGAARAAVADRVGGRSVVVVTATNAQAAAVAAQVRDQLVKLGLVRSDGGVPTGRDGNTASIGDVIACRRNDHSGLGVTNQAQYVVLDTARSAQVNTEHERVGAEYDRVDDGWLLVRETSGRDPIRLPGEYVSEHVQLGYASTVHSAQGLTVDSAHLVAGGEGHLDAAGLYVAMTRGRQRNTAHVALATRSKEPSSVAAAATPGGGQVRIQDTSRRSSARESLESGLTSAAADAARLTQRPGEGVAATVAAERALEREASMATITARLEAETRRVCRSRVERHLDDLVHDGVLAPHIRGRLASDLGTEHLSRLLRAAEQAGHDPRQILTDAITVPQATGRGLDDAESVAQVLSHRITSGRPPLQPAETPTGTAQLPASIPAADAETLGQLHERAASRRAQLGEQTAAEAPDWAVQALGPVPDLEQATDRADWQDRAGIVAGHREAVGWTHPRQAIDRMPGLSNTENRASFAEAWLALGRPETRLDETAMTDGQILNRITAWKREQEWAPPFADHQLRAAENAAETARQGAALATAAAQAAAQAGDVVEAERLNAEAAIHRETATYKAQAAEGLTRVAAVRQDWVAATMGTRDAHDRAVPEAERRGLNPGWERDRTTAENWLDIHRREVVSAAAEDDATAIADSDVQVVTDEDAKWAAAQYDYEKTGRDSGAHREPVPAVAGPSAVEIELMVSASALAARELADRTSLEARYNQDAGETLDIEAAEASRRRRDLADFDQSRSEPVSEDVSVSDA